MRPGAGFPHPWENPSPPPRNKDLFAVGKSPVGMMPWTDWLPTALPENPWIRRGRIQPPPEFRSAGGHDPWWNSREPEDDMVVVVVPRRVAAAMGLQVHSTSTQWREVAMMPSGWTPPPWEDPPSPPPDFKRLKRLLEGLAFDGDDEPVTTPPIPLPFWTVCAYETGMCIPEHHPGGRNPFQPPFASAKSQAAGTLMVPGWPPGPLSSFYLREKPSRLKDLFTEFERIKRRSSRW